MAGPHHFAEGKQLRESIDDLGRTHVDVEAVTEFERRPENGIRSLETKRSRAVVCRRRTFLGRNRGVSRK